MMDEIFDKLQSVADRYDELNELISDPDIIADTQKFMKLSKEEGSLRETVEKYNEYKNYAAGERWWGTPPRKTRSRNGRVDEGGISRI